MNNIRCPKCSSNNVVSGRKGFGFGRATIGALLLGPIGFMAGGIGSKTILMQCMDCSHTWNQANEIRRAKEDEKLRIREERLKQKWKNLFKM